MIHAYIDFRGFIDPDRGRLEASGGRYRGISIKWRGFINQGSTLCKRQRPDRAISVLHMRYCLNSLRGGCIGIVEGSTTGLMKGDTRSLDYSSYGLLIWGGGGPNIWYPL